MMTMESPEKHQLGPTAGYTAVVTGYPQTHPTYPQHNQGYASPYPSYSAPSDPYHPGDRAAYYAVERHHHFESEQTNDKDEFGHHTLYLLIAIVATTFCMSFVTWLIFGSEIPEFEVTGLQMKSFNGTTDAELTTDFQVNITVTNSDANLQVLVHRLENAMLYKDIFLARHDVEKSFEVDKKERVLLQLNLRANDSSIKLFDDLVAREIGRDRANKQISFNMKMELETTFTYGKLSRRVMISAYCEDLQVNFNEATDVGTLAPSPEHRVCLVLA